MANLLNKINSVVWGPPTLSLIFFTGIILSVRTKFFQIRFFKDALKTFFKSTSDSKQYKMSPFQSASTALSATMGTGNIVGVAGAIALGGPGAIFWMWCSAIFCMIIKFAEIILSVRYRERTKSGEYQGGAMYYMKNALPRFFVPLAYCFCFCGVVASFGVGNMTQINTMSSCVSALLGECFNTAPHIKVFVKIAVGVLCAVCSAIVLKNDGSIGKFCEKMFPLMTTIYICITTIAILLNYKKIPEVFAQIFIGAFNPKVVTGGAIGSAFVGMRFGMSRGIFSNEAGLGTAPTVYACSTGDEVQLGFMGIMEVFIDTMLVCTLTAVTILCAGEVTYSVDTAANLTLDALRAIFGKNIVFLFCPVVCFFAFSSTIGWGLYGTKFLTFLLGEGYKKTFLFVFCVLMIPAAVFRADVVWVAAEIMNGIMALPNITALLFLCNEVADTANAYKKYRPENFQAEKI